MLNLDVTPLIVKIIDLFFFIINAPNDMSNLKLTTKSDDWT